METGTVLTSFHMVFPNLNDTHTIVDTLTREGFLNQSWQGKVFFDQTLPFIQFLLKRISSIVF